MKFGLTDETIKKINSVLEKYPEVEQVIIYGSRAKGNYREGSDIDLTLKGENLTHNILLRINGEIDDLNTPYLFDTSIFETLNSPVPIAIGIEELIGRVGQVFWKK